MQDLITVGGRAEAEDGGSRTDTGGQISPRTGEVKDEEPRETASTAGASAGGSMSIALRN